MGNNFSILSLIWPKAVTDNQTKENSTRKYIALDQSGTLGSLFDECRDAILAKLSIDLQPRTPIINETITCDLFKGRVLQMKNLLEMADIDDLLQLGLLCKMVVPTGIASVIDYPHSIDDNTRFLHFKLRSFCESYDVDALSKNKSWKTLVTKESASHMITEVDWGIHTIIALRLPTEHIVESDSVLEKMVHRLRDKSFVWVMTEEENHLCMKITSIKVYSNIPDLTEMNQFLDVCEKIVEIRENRSEHRRMSYILTSLQTLDPDHHGNTDNDHFQIDSGQINQIVRHFYKQLSQINALRFLFEEELLKLSQNKLEESIDEFRPEFAKLIELYKSDAQKTYQLVHKIRKGQLLLSSLDGFSNSEAQLLIEKTIQNLESFLNALIEKERFIQQLQNNGYQYCNVAKCGIDQDCDEQLVRYILFKGKQKKIFICSTDQLNQGSSVSWDWIHSQLAREKQKNRHVLPVYADFTYSTWRLDKMIILPSKKQPIPTAPSPVFENIPSQSELTNSFINILLLGESGVGKSTFINAFANYLHFDSLEKAKTGQPIVVIPVSFLMTTGQDFEQRSINFGDVDPNENHNTTGQSVTQQCRSYVFEIASGKKLRIIDTPGFADTRGDSQDQMNMDAVFSFVSNLTHLNAVCLLLKPNVARLNPFLYTCFTRIFEWFGEGIRDHLIFCFTNARSTFFAPGDTRPLLKAFLKKFHVAEIPFERKNTFCFDSESFRYLMALQNNLKFDQLEEDEFVKSWIRSVDESRRLQTSLCDIFHPYRRNVEWQSMKDLHHQINSMIRPMLEGIRNILRNHVLFDKNCSIRLKATAVDYPSMICYKCERTPKRFDSFWIYPDLVHHSANECSSNELIPTEYTLDYEYLVECTENSQETLGEQETFLYDACVKFAHFLLITKTRNDDPFLSSLQRMVEEETNIHEKHKEAIHNQVLVSLLDTVRVKYQESYDQVDSNKDDQSLPNMYELIQLVNEIPIINEQMHAILKYQESRLNSNERDIDRKTTNSFY